jgi:hypothetical protein
MRSLSVRPPVSTGVAEYASDGPFRAANDAPQWSSQTPLLQTRINCQAELQR